MPCEIDVTPLLNNLINAVTIIGGLYMLNKLIKGWVIELSDPK